MTRFNCFLERPCPARRPRRYISWAERRLDNDRWVRQKAGRVPGTGGDYYSAYGLFVIPLPLGTL